METWIQWAGGLAFVALSGLVGYMFKLISDLSTRQDKMIEHMGETIDEIHERINGVKEGYVRRDDFKDFKEDLKATLQRMEGKQDETMKMIRSN
jgi:hypothetical protein